MKIIKIKTDHNTEHAVGSWHKGKLAFYRRAENGSVFSEYPAKECSLKNALQHIEQCYNSPSRKVSAFAIDAA